MISFKPITIICLGMTLCTAQIINISGVVKDSAGSGISEATVKLEVADISTTTGADGSFTLTNGSTKALKNIKSSTTVASPIQFQNGKISIKLSKDSPVIISIHNVNGQLLYSKKQIYSKGRYTIQTPLQTAGIHFFKVSIGKEAYTFKCSPFGTYLPEQITVLSGTDILTKQAKTISIIADVISVVKEGQINYRDSIKTSDTNGIVVKMIPNVGNVTDVDGNVYQSVRIGKQVWTVENLKTTKYNDGTDIPCVTGNTQWAGLTTAAYCFYENNSANKAKYGALYNWYAVATGKLAPNGWRVPTVAEWDTLASYLIANGYYWDVVTSGNKIAKSIAAKTDWNISTTAGAIGRDLNKNNATGFSAIPGGSRNGGSSNFSYQNNFGYWWSATVPDAEYAYSRLLCYNTMNLDKNDAHKRFGFSVRLLRD